MKIRMVSILVLLCACLGLARSASAQDFWTADSYYDVSMYGTTVYSSVVVEGQVNNNIAPPGCQHTYFNDSYLDGSGMYQQSDPTRDYVSLENDQQAPISESDDMTLDYTAEVDCSCVGQVYYDSFTIHFVPVILHVDFLGTVLNDDDAHDAYYEVTGTYDLGPIVFHGTTAPPVNGCGVGYEVVGHTYPSSTTIDIPMHRTIVSQQIYQNSTLVGGAPPGTPDDSATEYTDTNPQSSGSNGNVYDLDAPGGTPDPYGNILRYRTNFFEIAAGGDGNYIVLSNPVYFYARVSCSFNGQYQLVNDVPYRDDNQAGYGSTDTSANLGEE